MTLICMGRAMFTIIGAMAELESSLISERVTAGMRAPEARGKHLGRPPTPQHVVSEIVALATSTDLSIRQIQATIAGRASRSMVGEIQAGSRHRARTLVTTFYTYPEPRPCCPVLRRYFGEARPVATTIEAGLIDGRAKIKIEVSV